MLVVAGCGASHRSARTVTSRRHAVHRAAARPAPRPSTLRYRRLYTLAAPLRDPAFGATGGGRFLLAGGLDAADVSSAEITDATLHGVLGTGTLPAAQHDAQGAFLDGNLYVFGGGSLTELDHILQISRIGGHVGGAGTMPRPQSDVAVAATASTAYIVGGFDGTDYLHTVLAWHPGAPPRPIAQLPVGLRYAAVAIADGSLLVLGGSTPTGASDAIYRLVLDSDRVRRIGRLPQPTTHGTAAVLGGFVYLVGGRGDALDGQTDRIWSIDPHTGQVRAAGRLPTPTSDAAVLTLGDRLVVVGGQSPTSTLATVGALVPLR